MQQRVRPPLTSTILLRLPHPPTTVRMHERQPLHARKCALNPLFPLATEIYSKRPTIPTYANQRTVTPSH